MKLNAVHIVLLMVACTWGFPGSNHRKVLLQDVTALTLRQHDMTAGRRSSPVPQLTCVGGGSKYQPSIVQCTQTGFDGVDAQWACSADLPQGVSFGRISVSCEGFDYPDDPYVLAGSCGLQYELVTDSSHHGHGDNYGRSDSYVHSDYRPTHRRSSSSSSSWATWLMVGVVAFIGYNVCKSRRGGASAGNANDGTRRQPPPPRNDGGFNTNQGGYNSGFKTQTQAAPTQAAPAARGGGFWTGMGLGGLAGYMMGGRNRGYGTRANTFGHTPYRQAYRPAPPTRTFGGGFSGSSGGGTRRATGFGGTTRR